MKNSTTILFSILLVFGCITSKDIEKLTFDKTLLYPIGKDDKWGFANSEGKTIIEPVFDKVEFFRNGLSVVQTDGKYGYLKKDGSWHIKPKYDSASSFFSNCASVSINKQSFFINRKGRNMLVKDCKPVDGGGCLVRHPVDPNKYFKVINGKYELVYKYVVKTDTSNFIEIIDTSNFRIDEVIPFSRETILLKKNDKYGLFDIWGHSLIIIDKNKYPNFEDEANLQISKQIEFNFDDVIFERFLDNEVSHAKVKIGTKYGVINSFGQLLIEAEYENLEIEPGWNMALVEFESNMFGYKHFNGKEFFKRKENYQ